MLFKLSIKNIKKSIKDYSIYFFTLVFAISMFYMFNSIDAQSSMMVLNASKRDIIESLVYILDYVSVFVSIVLGFLIVYSNNFLIKRRKKEIGLYFTLGMSKRKVSLILVLETIFIGIVSLVVGLLLGIGLSQLLSMFTAKLFEVDMSNYHFIFSIGAFKKTILYFSIIYLLVIFLNVFILSRYKLIDLLTANHKNEKVKIRNKYVCFGCFILAAAFLGYAYYLLFNNALVMMDYHTVLMLAFGSVGTFFLFFSLSGFLLKIIQRNKKVYYHGLNTFILRQVNSKINTTVVSISVICLMLLLTIGSLSGSMSLADVFNKDLRSNNMTDFTVSFYNHYNESNQERLINKEKLIKNTNLSSMVKEYTILHRYTTKSVMVTDIMTKEELDKIIQKYGSSVNIDYAISIISESEYQSLMKVQGQKYYEIDDDEYLLLCNVDFIINAYTDYHNSGKGITIGEHHLVPNNKIVKTTIENSSSASNDGVIVVSDDLVKDLSIERLELIGNYANEKVNEREFSNLLYGKGINEFQLYDKEDIENNSVGLKTMVIFIGLYLGITFAISSATVLAIGQLSESSDNRNRYRVLRQIGADTKMINRALFIQIAITFMFPLIVALVHSYFGLREINNLLISFGKVDLTSNLLITTLFMIVVYGGYFLLTYLSSKNILKEEV